MQDADRPVPGPDGAGGGNWEPPRRTIAAGAAPMLSVEGFEGPLDWLLELVRARRINLARLSIVALVDAFAAALSDALAEADRHSPTLARCGDWLVMAADLALLRSRLLVPGDAAGAKAAQDTADILHARLISRAAMRAAAEWLGQRDQLGWDVFARGSISNTPGTGRRQRTAILGRTPPAQQAQDVTALLRACLAVLRLPPDAESRYRLAAAPPWSVADAAARIRALLPAMPVDGMTLAELLPERPGTLAEPERWCRSTVASTFMAGLELTREGNIAFQQEDVWATIQVRQSVPQAGEIGEQVA